MRAQASGGRGVATRDAVPGTPAAASNHRLTRTAASLSPDERLDRAQRLGHRWHPGPWCPDRSRLPQSPSIAGTIQRGGKPSKTSPVDPEPDRQKAEALFATNLQEGIAVLSDNIGVGFGASPENRFDATHWEKVDDEQYRFALKAKGKPSSALAAMFADPSKWSFDCAEFRQVVYLYAMWKTYGEAYLDEHLSEQPSDFRLRQHDSTGMFQPQFGPTKAPMAWMRSSKDQEFAFVVYAYDTKKTIAESVLLPTLPVGTLVCFKNHDMAEGTPYRNENAVVDGVGTFAAHPMGRGLAKTDIVDKLKAFNLKTFGDEGEDGVFISQICVPSSMALSKKTIDELDISDNETVQSALYKRLLG